MNRPTRHGYPITTQRDRGLRKLRVLDGAGRPRGLAAGYRCTACGEWTPAGEWQRFNDGADCPTCSRHFATAELPRLEEARWLRIAPPPGGARLTATADRDAPDSQGGSTP